MGAAQGRPTDDDMLRSMELIGPVRVNEPAFPDFSVRHGGRGRGAVCAAPD
jgi:hypothetical protein